MPIMDFTGCPLHTKLVKILPDLQNDFKKLKELNIPQFRQTDNWPVLINGKKVPLYSGKDMQSYNLLVEEDLCGYYEKPVFIANHDLYVEKTSERRKIASYCDSLIINFPDIRQMYFDELLPGARINEHLGVRPPIPHMRIQVVIDAGNNAFFYNEDKILEYRDNILFCFNDGFENHWVENKGTVNRTVLIIDVNKSYVEQYLSPYKL